MEANRKTITFSILGIALLYFFYSVRSVLAPFVVGMIVAYLLDPIVDKMEEKGINRGFATSLIITLFFTIIVGLAIIIIPIIYDQIVSFLRRVPEYIEYFDNKIYPLIEKARESLGIVQTQSENVNGYINNNPEKILEITRKFFQNLLSSSMGIISTISMLLIMPITAFYMLKDWDNIVVSINKNLPKKYAGTIKKIFTEVDRTVSRYIRGQIQVCLMLGLFYGIALTIAGLEFGFLIGFTTGLVSFVPYIGMLIGVAIGLVVALFQYGSDFASLGMILGIFAIGSIIEGNLVTPKLIGKKVGLHPMWIIFGLLTGGTLMGFVGVLLAVPITAVIGVLVKFTLEEYRKNFADETIK